MMTDNTPQKVAVICGPTASGKSALAMKLAETLGSEIICADSRQVYKEMLIGTARPLQEEMNGITHHLCGHISIQDPYDAGRFERESLRIADGLLAQNKLPILCGGTGLYLKAFCQGLSAMPGRNEELRIRLSALNLHELQEALLKLDPNADKLVDMQNPQRLLRAIELCTISGKTLQDVYKHHTAQERTFTCVYIGLEWDRARLYERIEARCDLMLKKGLLKEVEHLYEHRDLEALHTVGYREFFRYLDGELSLSESIELFKRNSRRYAKRQLTWLRNQNKVHWLDAESTDLLQHALSILNHS